MRNVVLIGLPGSGKTTLGRSLAARLNLPFRDVDRWIEKKSGLAIGRMFAGYGEDFFRAVEKEAVKRLASPGGAVIATGGGAVLDPDNARLLRENGLVVLVDRPVERIAADIQYAHRPLLKDGPGALVELEKRRRNAYRAAAHVTLSNDGSLEDALERLAVLADTAMAGDGFAVIGDPIGHSLSPAIHEAAFKVLGVQASYRAIHVPRGRLADFVRAARAVGLRGFNVTLPHKQDILSLLDEINDDARLCGAVNTVTLRENRLCGSNTDMEGLLLALKEHGSGYHDRRVVILGAGGAAAGIVCKAAREGAAGITLLARRPEQAATIRAVAERGSPVSFFTGGMVPEELERAASRADLLINATPLGMHGIGEEFSDLRFVEALPSRAVVCDLVYNPPVTRLLARASARGLRALNGMAMLIYQALLADEQFLNRPINKPALYRQIKKTIKENKEAAV